MLSLKQPETQTSGVGNLDFSKICMFTKWWPFLNFFIMTDADISFLLMLRKPETNFGGIGSLEFLI